MRPPYSDTVNEWKTSDLNFLVATERTTFIKEVRTSETSIKCLYNVCFKANSNKLMNWYFVFILTIYQSTRETIVVYSYADACRNIFNKIKTSGHSSLEKYTFHFIWKGSKGFRRVLLCERWVGDWTELQHIDPHSSGYHSFSSPFSRLLNQGPGGPASAGTWFSFHNLLSNWSELPVAGVI